MKKITVIFLSLLCCIAGSAQLTYFKAMLEGSQEVPPNASTATGIAIVKYDASTKLLVLHGDYQGLATAVTASHVHSPAAAGVNAPVLFSVTNSGGTSGTLYANATLTAGQETDLLAGNMYVNVHNTTYPGGEIRGQLSATTAGQTEYLTARVQGAQQVPPNGSVASGSARLLLDKTTGMIYLTGSFTGLAASAAAAHIHIGAVGANGGVIINLTYSAATQGTIHAASAIAPADQTQMMQGNAYVNIHNATYPGGEIRGQLIAESDLVYLKANMQGSQEVPPNASTAIGTQIVRYNKATKSLELTGDYQNLSAAITASHIHGPAAVGANAAVLFNLTNTGGTSGNLSTVVTLTAPQEADLLAGLMYVNVHNASFPGGEIRGQLTTTNANQTFYLTGQLSGTQEIPSNASTATGNATVLLDKLSGEVFLTGSFSGLTANASAAHIHRAAAGTNGPVVVNLSPTAALSGSVTGSAVVSAGFADSMILGLTYINIHNPSFPGGEIRAQFGNLVLPLKLTSFNGYRQNSTVILEWESTEESNLQQYEIEQQGETAGSWMKKGVVAAKNTSGLLQYSFTDIPPAGNTGYVVYRLKMVDKDGKFSYSKAIRINFTAGAPGLTIAANPVTNGVLRYLVTGLPGNKRASIMVIDYSGKTVLLKTAILSNTNTMDIGNLAAGIYRLIIRTDENMLQQAFTK